MIAKNPGTKKRWFHDEGFEIKLPSRGTKQKNPASVATSINSGIHLRCQFGELVFSLILVRLIPNFNPEDFVSVVATDVEFGLLLNDLICCGLQINRLNQVAAESIPDRNGIRFSRESIATHHRPCDHCKLTFANFFRAGPL